MLKNNINSSDLAKYIRKHSLLMTHAAKSSHIGSCLSYADILAVLYMSLDIAAIGEKVLDRDYVLVSKGHAAAAYYACLKAVGLLPHSLDDYSKSFSSLSGHVTCKNNNGVEFSSGSLGQGLSICVGIALGQKLRGHTKNTYCIMSDGELNEGSVWEAIMFAGHKKLNNLFVLLDKNELQSFGFTKDVLDMDPLKDKLESFGWSFVDIDGHDHKEIKCALELESSSPVFVCCNTVKGKGVSFMENKLEWHYRSVTNEQLQNALLELENK